MVLHSAKTKQNKTHTHPLVLASPNKAPLFPSLQRQKGRQTLAISWLSYSDAVTEKRPHQSIFLFCTYTRIRSNTCMSMYKVYCITCQVDCIHHSVYCHVFFFREPHLRCCPRSGHLTQLRTTGRTCLKGHWSLKSVLTHLVAPRRRLNIARLDK